MPFKEYQEIKEKLHDWKQWIKPYATSNNRKAYINLLTTFLPFFGVCILMYLLYETSYVLTLFLGLIGGLLMVRIFIIQHDCGHQSYFSSRRKNNFVGLICSIFTLIPFKYWARSHNHHHSHNAQLDNRDIGDITLLTVEEYSALSTLGKWKYRLYRSSLIMFLIGPLYYIFVHNRLPLIRVKGWEKERYWLWLSNLILTFFYGTLVYLFGFKSVLLVQLPIVTTFAVVAIWVFYIQHQHDPNYKAWKGEWDFLIASIKGSSYYKLPKLGHWFTGNIGYHRIHHLAPRVPFYNLARCHNAHPLFDKYATKLNFFNSFKCAFYKLWDEENKRMITFRDFHRKKRQLVELG